MVLGWYAQGRLALAGERVELDGLPLAAPVQFVAAGDWND
jgi:hypothetical protein